jgi:hypothetical protein
MWETMSGTPRMDYLRVGAPVLEVALSSDGQRFAGVTEHSAFVGDVEMQNIIGPRLHVPAFGGCIALNHDGTKLAIAFVGGSTVVYQIAPPLATPPDWFASMTSILISKRFTKTGVIETTEQPGLPAILKTLPAALEGPWGNFARWLVAPPNAQRSLNPWVSFSLEDYAKALSQRPGETTVKELRRLRPMFMNTQAAAVREDAP